MLLLTNIIILPTAIDMFPHRSQVVIHNPLLYNEFDGYDDEIIQHLLGLDWTGLVCLGLVWTTTSSDIMSIMDMMMKLSNTYLVMTWVMVCPLVVYHYTPLYIHNPWNIYAK